MKRSGNQFGNLLRSVRVHDKLYVVKSFHTVYSAPVTGAIGYISDYFRHIIVALLHTRVAA